MCRPRHCLILSPTPWICASPQCGARITRAPAMQSTGVGLSDLAYFDNMLATDESVRRKKHELMLRVFDAPYCSARMR